MKSLRAAAAAAADPSLSPLPDSSEELSVITPAPLQPASHSLPTAAAAADRLCASRGEWFTLLKDRVTAADEGRTEGGTEGGTEGATP